jgi:DNA-binding NarL/FixJ family response regulator
VPESLRVLVVDDDPSLRALIRCWLSTEECVGRIEECSSAADALDAVAGGSFDVVVLDHHMPDLNGLAVLPDLRRATTAHIIMFSAGMGAELATAAVARGADQALLKSGDMSALSQAVCAVTTSERDACDDSG